ncbi:winged helix DNA-binding domain-containing protein [Actinophytocola sp.]|uniref:winged helix DNA-binding domain-containing protein n=1 Tax=Actinophytocola sp. TaxID=1872138 RepID=UPI003D6B8F01
MRRLSARQTRMARAAAQGLAGTAGTVADAVRRVVGVQAQDVRAGRLAVRVRTSGLTAHDVDDAVRTRAVVRTWAMRGTLHMVAADDFFWLGGLLGPYFAARGVPRRRQLGLGDDLLDRAAAALETIAMEPVTRGHIVARLADHGVRLDARSQAPAHLLAHAANTGRLCRGPDTATDEPTYVLVREWLGPPPGAHDEDDALRMLAERYLRGHGPATAEDLATWSGLPVTRTRQAFGLLGDRVEHVDAAGRPAVMLGDGPRPGVPTRLLGHFDAYLLGYRGRDLAVPKAHQRAVQAGGGFVMPVVLGEGQAVGTWRMTSTKDSIRVAVAGFGGRKLPDICNETADLGRFLGKRAVPVA